MTVAQPVVADGEEMTRRGDATDVGATAGTDTGLESDESTFTRRARDGFIAAPPGNVMGHLAVRRMSYLGLLRTERDAYRRGVRRSPVGGEQ